MKLFIIICYLQDSDEYRPSTFKWTISIMNMYIRQRQTREYRRTKEVKKEMYQFVIWARVESLKSTEFI